MLHIINIYNKTYFNLKYGATNTKNKNQRKSTTSTTSTEDKQ